MCAIFPQEPQRYDVRRTVRGNGLTVLEQAGMVMWDQLKSLGLVEYGDQLMVKDIIATD
jgi:hypothetical protein